MSNIDHPSYCDCGLCTGQRIRTTPPAVAPPRPKKVETIKAQDQVKKRRYEWVDEHTNGYPDVEDVMEAMEYEADHNTEAILESLRDEMCLGCTNKLPVEEDARKSLVHRHPDGGTTYCMCSVYVRVRLAALEPRPWPPSQK